MSTDKSKDFNRVDRPEVRGDTSAIGTPDRFQQYKVNMKNLLEYREAYLAAQVADPESVRGLPHPDGDSQKFDPAEALESLRKLRGGLKAVPGRDIET